MILDLNKLMKEFHCQDIDYIKLKFKEDKINIEIKLKNNKKECYPLDFHGYPDYIKI